MNLNRHQRDEHRRAFTLIEALVVVVIITLLLTLLVPSLGAARRAARLIKCGANLRQFAVGLIQYADDVGGGYPSHWATAQSNLRSIWVHDYPPLGLPDKDQYLDHFVDVVGGGSTDAMWCPLDVIFVPGGIGYTGEDPNHPGMDHVTSNGRDMYMIGYQRFAGHTIPGSYVNMGWSNSGNAKTNEAPTRRGDARDAIISDVVWSEEPNGFVDAHSTQIGIPERYRDNNVAYGDGRVETHRHEFDVLSPAAYWNDHYVLRNTLLTPEYRLY